MVLVATRLKIAIIEDLGSFVNEEKRDIVIERKQLSPYSTTPAVEKLDFRMFKNFIACHPLRGHP